VHYSSSGKRYPVRFGNLVRLPELRRRFLKVCGKFGAVCSCTGTDGSGVHCHRNYRLVRVCRYLLFWRLGNH